MVEIAWLDCWSRFICLLHWSPLMDNFKRHGQYMEYHVAVIEESSRLLIEVFVDHFQPTL